MKYKILVPALLLCSVGSYAQNMFNMASLHAADTLRSERQEQAIRYPSLRQGSVAINVFGSSQFDSDEDGRAFASGKNRNVRISSFYTIPITQWNGNAIGVTIYHNHQFFNISEVKGQSPETLPEKSDF